MAEVTGIVGRLGDGAAVFAHPYHPGNLYLTAEQHREAAQLRLCMAEAERSSGSFWACRDAGEHEWAARYHLRRAAELEVGRG